MSKIVYNYGVMNSAKTAQLLMTHHTYINKGIKPLLLKPSVDNRDGIKTVTSRVGLSYDADLSVPEWIDIDFYLDKFFTEEGYSQVILIDEAQFFTPELVHKIVSYARRHNLSVLAYGLLKTFQNKLFEGSEAWLEECDTILEVKTSCSVNGCERKATCNLRLQGDLPVYEGDTVQIGGEESYTGVCANHWHNYPTGGGKYEA